MRTRILPLLIAAALATAGGIVTVATAGRGAESGGTDGPADRVASWSATSAASTARAASPSVESPTAPRTASVPGPGPGEPAITFPEVGSRTYLTVPGSGPVIGHAGLLMRYRIAVEQEIAGLDVDAFAGFVEQTYADPRGWTAGGAWRLQRVGPGQPADFTLYLVTPATRDQLCVTGYDRYTSCRNGASVVLNVARWVRGVPHFGAPLETYRRYMVNHETGHRLGNGHELCPAAGAPAPVMQQQTLGLHGCVANPWPYLDGKRHRGRSGQYGDRLPPPP